MRREGGMVCLERRFAFKMIPRDISLRFVLCVHGECRIVLIEDRDSCLTPLALNSVAHDSSSAFFEKTTSGKVSSQIAVTAGLMNTDSKSIATL